MSACILFNNQKKNRKRQEKRTEEEKEKKKNDDDDDDDSNDNVKGSSRFVQSAHLTANCLQHKYVATMQCINHTQCSSATWCKGIAKLLILMELK